MNNKVSSRLLSFLLAMVMILGTISPAFAAGLEAPIDSVQNVESELISENGKLRARLVAPKNAQVQTKRAGLFRAPAKEPGFDNTTVKVEIKKHGIGSNEFNFDAIFGAEASKTITLYNDADDSEQKVTFNSTDTSVKFPTAIPMKDIVNGDAYIEFEGGNVAGKLTYEESADYHSGAGNVTTFKLDLYQVKNTDVVVTTKTADGTVVDNPKTANTNGNIKLGSMNIEKDIPTDKTPLTFVDNIYVKDVNTLNGDPNYEVTGLENGVLVDKADNKVYKPTIGTPDPNGIEPTEITFTEKPLVTTDDMSGDTDYVKVTFDAGDKGTIVENKTYYVFKGVEMESALTPPDVTENKGWEFNGWNPTLATKYDNPTEHVAQYSKDVIPGTEEPTNPDPDKYVKVTMDANATNYTGATLTGETFYWVKKGHSLTADDVAKTTAKLDKASFKEWTLTAATTATDKLPQTINDEETLYAQYNAGSTPTDKSEKPTIDQPSEGDKKITGKGKQGADIEVELPDGTKIPGKVDNNGDWEVTVPANNPLKKDDVIKATQTETGKKPSDPAKETVKGKVTPPSFNYLTLTLDENYRGGEITHHDLYEDELIERYLYTPHRRGYVFEGWSYRSDYLDEVRPGDRIYYSTTLYAIWSRDRYYDRDEREEEPEDTREVLEHKVYMFGYTDGTVRPNGRITRAEAAALVTRLLGIESIGAATKPMFTDTPSAWYNKAINAAVQRGIMKGYPDGRFRPNAPITRAEFTQMISTIDNKPYGVAPFADVKGHWAERPIGSEYQAGRIKGYPDGTFRPNAFITRCEAVVILNKMFERNYDAMSLKDAKNAYLIKGFIDLPTSFWGYYDMIEATNSHSFKRRVQGKVQEDWTLVK